MTDPPSPEPFDGTRHHRHYTLEQAMAVRGWVAERVAWVRDAQARLMGLGATLAVMSDAAHANQDKGSTFRATGSSLAASIRRLQAWGGVAERSMAADCKSADFTSTKVRILPPPPLPFC